MDETKRIKGKVITFGQGHGMVEGEDGQLYFVHHGSITAGSGAEGVMAELAVGSTVEFEPLGEGDEAMAQDVQVVK
jgi:hypothetical protein